jgi:hypothetical protein
MRKINQPPPHAAFATVPSVLSALLVERRCLNNWWDA